MGCGSSSATDTQDKDQKDQGNSDNAEAAQAQEEPPAADEEETELKKFCNLGFALLDVNDDKRIAASELKRFLKILGEFRSLEECEELVKKFDKDEKGSLSFDQCFEAVKEFDSQNTIDVTPNADSRVSHVFQFLDRNDDNLIDKEELQRAIKITHPDKVDRIDEILGNLDANSDGKVNYEEIAKALEGQ